MNVPIAVRIECAKGEILNAMEAIQTKHALPPCIMDGVLSSVLAERTLRTEPEQTEEEHPENPEE